MSEDNPSAVSEATTALYAVPHTVSQRRNLRKKLQERGVAALTTSELIAMILGSDGKGRSQALLQRHGLAKIAEVTLAELLGPFAMTPAGASRLVAALELHRRLIREDSQERPRLNRPEQVYREVRDIRRGKREQLVGLYLDAQNGLLHRETISIGSLNTTRTHPREILYPAIQHVALGFILAHNHPSGCLDPSPEDLEFTNAVKRAGELIGIELYDHLIVAGEGYTSMRERGLL